MCVVCAYYRQVAEAPQVQGSYVQKLRDTMRDTTGKSPSIRLPSRKVAHPTEVYEVPPAVVGEPDEGIVAARAADDGAQLPHLVDHRSPELTGPSAPTT